MIACIQGTKERLMKLKNGIWSQPDWMPLYDKVLEACPNLSWIVITYSPYSYTYLKRRHLTRARVFKRFVMDMKTRNYPSAVRLLNKITGVGLTGIYAHRYQEQGLKIRYHPCINPRICDWTGSSHVFIMRDDKEITRFLKAILACYMEERLTPEE